MLKRKELRDILTDTFDCSFSSGGFKNGKYSDKVTTECARVRMITEEIPLLTRLKSRLLKKTSQMLDECKISEVRILGYTNFSDYLEMFPLWESFIRRDCVKNEMDITKYTSSFRKVMAGDTLDKNSVISAIRKVHEMDDGYREALDAYVTEAKDDISKFLK